MESLLSVMIGEYPGFSEIDLQQRPILHPRLRQLDEGISEFTFAGLYLFRGVHHYVVSRLADDLVVVAGHDANPFFMLPLGLPERGVLDELFRRFGSMKCVTASQAQQLSRSGYRVWEDRDNFDYLYRREELVSLSGRRLHKKKNLVNLFVRNNACVAKPLLPEYVPDARYILDEWRTQQDEEADYAAAREALERMDELQLCGGIFYVDERPVAYTLGEELAHGRSFVIHFEKAVVRPPYKGVYQYISQAFAAVLPDKYGTINREQDLGHAGIRRAKEGYRPVGFVKKYRAAQ